MSCRPQDHVHVVWSEHLVSLREQAAARELSTEENALLRLSF